MIRDIDIFVNDIVDTIYAYLNLPIPTNESLQDKINNTCIASCVDKHIIKSLNNSRKYLNKEHCTQNLNHHEIQALLQETNKIALWIFKILSNESKSTSPSFISNDAQPFLYNELNIQNNTTDLASITIKLDLDYIYDKEGISFLADSLNLEKVGIINPIIFNISLEIINEFKDLATKNKMPLYDGENSGLILTVEKAYQGSIIIDFIISNVDNAGTIAASGVIGGICHDTVKKGTIKMVSSIKPFFTSLKSKLSDKKLTSTENKVNCNVIDFKTNTKALKEWGNKK